MGEKKLSITSEKLTGGDLREAVQVFEILARWREDDKKAASLVSLKHTVSNPEPVHKRRMSR